MGYFNVGKYKIFYSDNRFLEINKPFYEKLSGIDMIGMKILGIDGKLNKNAAKLQNLQIQKVQEDYKKLSREAFIKKWVHFDFVTDEAKNNSWEILYDYFHIQRNGFIKDLRDSGQQIIDDFSGSNNYTFPQGEVVELKFRLTSNHNFFEKIFRKSHYLTTILDLTKIQRIQGSLTNLEIRTNNRVLKLSDSIEIMNNGG